ncbi:hypothetical protein [Polyangium mundeleinium]|uniref:Roadblock/LC7 domain-containing protein n=1 Tax=Polyangium mundeleinium TaxID=2995306 RepID=A0ABT5EPU1_9BACT|nr:hypothetical protein [Polyangium mundeleinium]MDC0743850.1 hypothetical protein [Polyangium mundeleinium]
MASADEIPAWLKLHRRLVSLQDGVGATNALVCDLSGSIFCCGLSRRWEGIPALRLAATLGETQAQLARELPAIGEMFERVLRARPPGKEKPGARFTVALVDEEPFAYAQSFAGVYVLLLCFSGPFTPFPVASKVRAALPEIEALTVMLPPPEGPDRETIAMRLRG